MAAFTLTPELAFTLRAAEAAIGICRRYPRELYTRKRDGTPVCKADLRIQSWVDRHLETAFPGDTLLAEEEIDYGSMGFLEGGLETSGIRSGREWILDPIDGTKGYLNGGFYATGLCLPDTCAGVGIPEEGVVLLAERGEMEIVRVCDGEGVGFRGGWLRSGGSARIGELGEERMLCCGSLVKYAAVARGIADVFVQVLRGGEKVWDHAAGLFVVEASGGCVSDEFGGWVGVKNGRLIAEGEAIVVSRKGMDHGLVCEIVARGLGI